MHGDTPTISSIQLLKPLTVLLAEDDPELSASMRRTLALFFSQVIAAESGDEAWRLFQEQRVQCAFLDIRMPGMSGLELARRIRNVTLDLPIVIVSAYQETPDLLAATSLYLVDYLLKPIRFDTLREVLQRVCSHLILHGKLSHELAPGVIYDPVGKSVFEQDRLLGVLTPKESLFFELLLRYSGRPVPLPLIDSQVYQNNMSLGALRTMVMRLRRKLGAYDRIIAIKDCGYLWKD